MTYDELMTWNGHYVLYCIELFVGARHTEFNMKIDL